MLTGFMGTGKTTVGKLIANTLSKKFVDMDLEIEAKAGMSISDIFAAHGEKYFRDLETQMAKDMVQRENSVISTGGGVVLRPENIEYLKACGPLVCLMASPQIIYERTKDSDDRPLLKTPDPKKKIEELLQNRMEHYEKADYVIDTDGIFPEDVVKKIIGIVS